MYTKRYELKAVLYTTQGMGFINNLEKDYSFVGQFNNANVVEILNIIKYETIFAILQKDWRDEF